MLRTHTRTYNSTGCEKQFVAVEVPWWNDISGAAGIVWAHVSFEKCVFKNPSHTCMGTYVHNAKYVVAKLATMNKKYIFLPVCSYTWRYAYIYISIYLL